MTLILDTIAIKQNLLTRLGSTHYIPWCNGDKNNKTAFYEISYPVNTNFSSYSDIAETTVKMINDAILNETINQSKISKKINKIPYLLNNEWFNKEQLSKAISYYYHAIASQNTVLSINTIANNVGQPLLLNNRFNTIGMLAKQNLDGININPKDAASGNILYPPIINPPYAYRFPFASQIWTDTKMDDNIILLIDDDLFNLKDTINELSIIYSYKNKWILQLPLIYNSTDISIINIS